MIIDIDPANLHLLSIALATPKAITILLKRGLITLKATKTAISSKIAKKLKQKHKDKLPINVCVEFKNIIQLVNAHIREKKRETIKEIGEAWGAKISKAQPG